MAKFLCTADVHIGRSSSMGGGVDSAAHQALTVWERIVDMAIAEGADAILLAGDFYDSVSAQYESRNHIRSSLEKLKDAGIPLVAVAGNHDCDALPDFARTYPDLIHLFPSETWTETTVAGIRIVGRSFARPTHRESMLRDFHGPGDGRPTIGLIPADINGVGGYGPTPLTDFRLSGVPAWVVGHIHMTREFLDGTVAYPGSPQALDWGETGPHGVRWLEVSPTGAASFSPVCPLSTVYYQYETVELSPGESLDERLRRLSEALTAANDHLKSVQFRVDLRVSSDDDHPFPGEAELDNDWYEVVSRVVVPAVNLKEEAKQSDAKGQAARLLLGMAGVGDPEWGQTVSDMTRQVYQRMCQERNALRLPPVESLEVLAKGAPDGARTAVRRMLERILTADGGAL